MKQIKKIALMLAFVLFVGYIPNIPITDIYASAPSLLFRSEWVLSEGTNNDIPVLTKEGQPQDSWMFEWDTSVLDEGESVTLKYQLEKDKVMNVRTTKTADATVQVDIELTKDDGTPIEYTEDSFEIYSNLDLDYASISKYFDATGAPSIAYNGDEDRTVLNTMATTTHTAINASFSLTNISRDVGYSIHYNGFDLHFLLKTDGSFDFYQDEGLEPGRVYSAELDYIDTAGVESVASKRLFSIGLDTDLITTLPFAETTGDSIPDEYAEYKYNIEDNDNVSLKDEDQVGFEYTIQLPYEYDEVAQNFKTKTVSEASQIVLNFSIPTDSNYLSMTIEIPANVSNSTLSSDIVVSSPPTFKDGGSYEILGITDNQLTIRFLGLQQGLLLTPTVSYTIVDSDIDNPSLVKPINGETTKAYTFPKYTIVNKDGADYVSIEPFEGYAGHYVLYSATATSDSAVNVTSLKYASSFFKENASSTDNVMLPLSPMPETDSKTYDYKIFFNPDVRFENPGALLDNGTSDLEKLIRTRYFEYESKDRGTIGFPNNFEINDVNQSKMFKPDADYDTEGSGNYTDDFQDLSYTLEWDLGRIVSIDKMLDESTDKQAEITYIVELGDTTESDEREDFLSITITLDGSGGSNNAVLVGDPEFEFIGEDGGLLTAPKESMNDILDVRLVTDYSSQSNGYVYRLEVDLDNVILDATAEAEYLDLDSDIFFKYPNIYFMVVRPDKVVTNGGATTSYFDESNSSVIKSVTLNKDMSTKLEEPVSVETNNVVTQFIGEETDVGIPVTQDQVSFEVWYKMQQESLVEYMNYYFTNHDLEDFGQNMKFTNDIYISQDYDFMNDVMSELDKDERIKNSVELDLSDYDFEASENDDGIPVVMMREFANNTTGPAVVLTEKGESGIEALRDGDVLRLSNIPMYEPSFDDDGNYVLPTSDILDKIVIDGLDTNTKYYVFVDLNVEYLSDDGEKRYLDLGGLKPLAESSDISGLASATTGSELQKPSITDEVPTMPDVELVETGRNSYTIKWDGVDMEISDPTRYSQEFQYEVLRIRDTKLQDEYLDTRLDLQHVFNNEIPDSVVDKSAQRIYEDEDTGKLSTLLYNEGSNTFIKPEDGLYMPTYDGRSITYEDNTLSANKVYFGYVRTVRIITDEETGNVFEVYSPWDGVSATTELGNAPLNLKVLYDYDEDAYDSSTEIPLSFQAKVPNINEIGNDITFEVTYKYDGEDWIAPITISSSELKNNASDLDENGYRTFYFILDDLKPGESYSIKVRQANADGSYTPYSNTVQWKTDIDDGDYDKGDELDSFEDLMDEEVQDLIDGSQVILENDSDSNTIMMNGNNLTNEIASSNANTLIINSLEKGKDNTIIVPFAAYKNTCDDGLAWQFSYDDMFFNMSANTVDSLYNKEIIEMNEKIDMDYIEDYYMEFIFDYVKNPSTLSGDERLTDLIDFKVKLCATTENVVDFQAEELQEVLDEVVESDAVQEKKQEILNEIAKDTVTSEVALGLVDEYVDYVQDRFQRAFKDAADDIRSERDDEYVRNLDKNIIMGTNYQNALSKVTAYSVNSSNLVMELPTTRSQDVSTAVIKNFGIYGFGGNEVTIVGDVNGNNVSNIVSENDLEDSLSNTGDTIVTSDNMTVAQALQSMSNINGLTVEETKALLSSNGIIINRNNEDGVLTQDLGVAMIGVLYEDVNNVNPDRVTIKDYRFYNDLKSSGINENYIKHIQLCKEMGIINSVPSTTKAVTVGEFLEMLDKI